MADTEVGIGGCCQWKLQGIDQDTTVAVMFEITGSGQAADQGQVIAAEWVEWVAVGWLVGGSEQGVHMCAHGGE